MIRMNTAWPLVVASALCLGACDTLDSLQKPPNFSAPGTVDNIPQTAANSQPIAAANVDPQPPAARGALWRSGSKTFFRDPRARAVGDLLTVAVNLQEQAEFNNQTNLNRSNSDSLNMAGPGFLGIPGLLKKVFPSSSSAVGASSTIATQGQGDVK